MTLHPLNGNQMERDIDSALRWWAAAGICLALILFACTTAVAYLLFGGLVAVLACAALALFSGVTIWSQLHDDEQEDDCDE